MHICAPLFVPVRILKAQLGPPTTWPFGGRQQTGNPLIGGSPVLYNEAFTGRAKANLTVGTVYWTAMQAVTARMPQMTLSSTGPSPRIALQQLLWLKHAGCSTGPGEASANTNTAAMPAYLCARCNCLHPAADCDRKQSRISRVTSTYVNNHSQGPLVFYLGCSDRLR